jgi:hypothetical protein
MRLERRYYQCKYTRFPNVRQELKTFCRGVIFIRYHFSARMHRSERLVVQSDREWVGWRASRPNTKYANAFISHYQGTMYGVRTGLILPACFAKLSEE